MISKDSHTQHISQQFNAELEEVRSHLLAMGGLVTNRPSASPVVSSSAW